MHAFNASLTLRSIAIRVVRVRPLMLAALIAIAGRMDGAIVARYRDAFDVGAGDAGRWSFWWNAPAPTARDHDIASAAAGGITDPHSYRRLEWSEKAWRGPDGLKLAAGGGSPGADAQHSGTTHGRYAISAFAVDRAGYYRIAESRLRKIAAGGGAIDVLIHANAWRPVLRKLCPPGQAIAFDTDVGYVPAGAIIYVAVGPGANSTAAEFELGFAIDRDERATLQGQIDAARACGEKQVRLLPGRYYAADKLSIRDWTDFAIDATGATLIAPPGVSAVSFVSCARGQLRQLTIDQDPLPLTQGVVLAIDPRRMQVELKIDDFYPMPQAGRPRGDRNMIFDAATLDQKQPAAGFNTAGIERLPADHCRLTLKRALAEEVAVGDVLSIQTSGGPPAFNLSQCEQMVVDAITLHSSADFSFFERGGSDNAYRHLILTPGPAHLLASRPRLRTSGSDGFHSRDARVGPKVTDSLFERTGDDGMAIDGPWGVVVADAPGNEVLVAVRGEGVLSRGEPLRFFRFAARDQLRATVAECEPADDRVAAARKVVKTRYPAFAGTNDYKHVFRLTLSGLEGAGFKAGDLVSFPRRNGEGFEFRNNTIRGGRSRGIIVKANGVVAGNRIENVQKPGILVYSAFGHDSMEAQFVENLVIADNTIEGCNFMRPVQNTLRYSGGIAITTDTAVDGTQWGRDGHRNIRIENNVIRALYRGVNLAISDASHVVVKNNRFIDTHRHAGGSGGDYGCDNAAVIWITEADDVVIEGCRVERTGPHADPRKLIATTPTATRVTGTLSRE